MDDHIKTDCYCKVDCNPGINSSGTRVKLCDTLSKLNNEDLFAKLQGVATQPKSTTECGRYNCSNQFKQARRGKKYKTCPDCRENDRQANIRAQDKAYEIAQTLEPENLLEKIKDLEYRLGQLEALNEKR